MKPTVIQCAVLAGVIAICLILIVRKSSAMQSHSWRSTDGKSRLSNKLEATPDGPVAFGPKCVWYSVKTTNSEEVLKEIGIKSPVRCNWKSGISAAYEGRVFLGPPVNGWTLVICRDFPTFDDVRRKKSAEKLLEALSVRFGEAHHYATHRVVEFHAWAKSMSGKITREYAYLGESGETLANNGEKTKEETEAGFGNDPHYIPTEDVVMKVAGKWSVDPSKLNDKSGPPGVGWLGEL